MPSTATCVVKRFDEPDEVRPFEDHGRAEVIGDEPCDLTDVGQIGDYAKR